jgi:hypothetical protein
MFQFPRLYPICSKCMFIVACILFPNETTIRAAKMYENANEKRTFYMHIPIYMYIGKYCTTPYLLSSHNRKFLN